MPVTAKLSKAFYDKFGDEPTNELVNWLKAVDETYRADLRELNEVNFARFDAQLEQRVAALDAKLEQRVAALDAKLEKRAVALDAKIEQLGIALRAEMKAGFVQSDATLERRLAELSGQFSDRLRNAEILLAGLTIVWVPVVLGIFEFVVRR